MIQKNSYWRAAEFCYRPNSLCNKTVVAFNVYEGSNNGKNNSNLHGKKKWWVWVDNYKSGIRSQCSKTFPWEHQLCVQWGQKHTCRALLYHLMNWRFTCVMNSSDPPSTLYQIRDRRIKQIWRMKVRIIKCFDSCTNNNQAKCSSDFKEMTEEAYDGLQYHKRHQESRGNTLLNKELGYHMKLIS